MKLKTTLIFTIFLMILGTKLSAVDAIASLNTDKKSYSTQENIIVSATNMLGDAQDWIGIYPKGSSNDWNNVIKWKWTNAIINGSITFDSLPLGEYEARAFFKNSFKLEASTSFAIDKKSKLFIETTKNSYNIGENIVVDFKNMKGEENQDWIAIYPKGSSNDWGNVIYWKWTHGLINGSITFDSLPLGEYEVRAFFNNSFKLEKSYPFTVRNIKKKSTIYEDGENGISPNWIHVSGNYEPIHVDNDGFNSRGALALVTEWVHNTVNLALYYLPIHNSTQKVLEMDVGGLANFRIPNKRPNQVGYMSHFGIGVEVKTIQGRRRMMWDSFLNHENVSAYRTTNEEGTNVWLYYPSPVEHVRGYLRINIHQWEHFRVDIEQQLKILEPNNRVISVEYLFLTGGFLDNIKLSSN